MNRWILIRRMRVPAFLILLGITALLNQWGVLSFGRSWPIYLILLGVFMLAEWAALTGGATNNLASFVWGGQTEGSAIPPAAHISDDPEYQREDERGVENFSQKDARP